MTYLQQAGEGNRTLVYSLEGCRSTIELHPHYSAESRAGAGNGGCRIRTYEGLSHQIYSLTPLAARETPRTFPLVLFHPYSVLINVFWID